MSKQKQYDQKKSTGSHYTPPKLAEFVARRILHHFDVDHQHSIRILDPACGSGELLEAFFRLASSSVRDRLVLVGVDNDASSVSRAEARLRELHAGPVRVVRADFLDIGLKNCGQTDFFNDAPDLDPFHAVIANPPYVRTQVMGAKKSQQLSAAFNLNGRIDLYQAFLVAMTQELCTGGILGAIVSNRFLSTKSGASTRKFLATHYNIQELYDLGDTKLFDAAILPAVFIGAKRESDEDKVKLGEFVRIYQSEYQPKNCAHTDSVFSILAQRRSGVYESQGQSYTVSSGVLNIPSDPSDLWQLVDPTEKLWLETIDRNSFCRIGDLVSVRVGIKTTADKVFIRSNWNVLEEDFRPEPELLHRLLTPDDAQKWRPDLDHEKAKYVLYTHLVEDEKRRAISLSEYPKAAAYLENNRERLEGRNYVIEAGRNWYEIWVPQDPSAWSKPKLAWPDIKGEPQFFYDDSGSIVKGNCYWITLDNEQGQDLLLLILGIANSNLMTRYHDLVFNNKLYSGRRRYLTQYVEKYPLPDSNSEASQRITALVRSLVFEEPEEAEIGRIELELEKAVSSVFGVKPVLKERNRLEVESVVCH